MDTILLASEVDFYIDTMKPTTLEDIGSKHFLEWHRRLQKLNQQAMVEAASVKEEYVKETLVTQNKIPILVHEAILINIWKNKVMPYLLRMDPEPDCTFVAYTVLFHEAVSVALLELIMFHPSSSESLGDFAADLLSYAYDTATQLLVLKHIDIQPGENGASELLRQQDDINFGIGIRCLSIIRYLAEHSDRLTFSVIDRLLNLHDVPILLIEILLNRPWIQDGKLYKNNQWVSWDGEALPQCEAQVWLALHQIILSPNCGPHYSITDSRRSQFMKLLPMFTPILLDQLSPLVDLKYWVCQLSVSNQPVAQPKPILLEVLPEIRTGILKHGEKKWKKLAKEQLTRIFTNDKKELMEIAQGLSDAYNTDLIEKLEQPEPRNCGACGKAAIQRCSKCKDIWYCSRRCQVDDWPKHKVHCIAPSVVNM